MIIEGVFSVLSCEPSLDNVCAHIEKGSRCAIEESILAVDWRQFCIMQGLTGTLTLSAAACSIIEQCHGFVEQCDKLPMIIEGTLQSYSRSHLFEHDIYWNVDIMVLRFVTTLLEIGHKAPEVQHQDLRL